MRAPADGDAGTVLGKAVLVLQAFHCGGPWRDVHRTGREDRARESTLHRILAELLTVRLVDRDGSRYRLGGRLFELGKRASVERTLLEVATPFMEDPYERTHETVHLGVREGVEVVYIAKFGGHRQPRHAHGGHDRLALEHRRPDADEPRGGLLELERDAVATTWSSC